MKEEDILVVYDKEQASATKAYIATHPTARVVCVDSWAERALSEVDVPFSSLKAADTDDEGMWWLWRKTPHGNGTACRRCHSFHTPAFP